MIHMEELDLRCPYCEDSLSKVDGAIMCIGCYACWLWSDIDENEIIHLTQYPIAIG